MKVPKIKSKKASELIKSILKKKNLQYILSEIREKKKHTKLFTGKILLPTIPVQSKIV